jgi:hypothetical protein
MRRVRNWDVLLTEWAIEQIGRPFLWGQTDCMSLVRRAAAVLYGGVDPFTERVPRWSDAATAAAVGQICGGPERALEYVGAVAVGWRYAQTGDVWVRPPEDGGWGYAAGVVVSGHLLRAIEDGEVAWSPLEDPGTGVVWRLPHG